MDSIMPIWAHYFYQLNVLESLFYDSEFEMYIICISYSLYIIVIPITVWPLLIWWVSGRIKYTPSHPPDWLPANVCLN